MRGVGRAACGGGCKKAVEGCRMAIGGQKGRVKVVLPLLQPSRRQNDVHAPPRYLPVARRLFVFPYEAEGNGGFKGDIVENRVTN